MNARARKHYDRNRSRLPSVEAAEKLIELYDALPDEAKQGVRLQDWLGGSFGPREETDLVVDEKNFDLLEEGSFRGIGSAFNVKFDSGLVPTIIKPGAFAKTIEEDRDRIKILWQHDVSEPIGKPTLLRETEVGLEVVAQLSDVPKAHDALELMRDNVINELSIGWSPTAFSFEEDGDELVRIVTELKLYEVSLVSFGANPGAKITDVNSDDAPDDAAAKSEIQTLIFAKKLWTLARAKAWLKEHDFHSGKVDETPNTYRFRQFDPSRCKAGSFVTLTKNFPAGVSAVSCTTTAAASEPLDNIEKISTIEDGDPSLSDLMDRISDAVKRMGDAEVVLDEDTLLRLELAHRRIGEILVRDAEDATEEEHDPLPLDLLEIDEAELVLRRNTE